ncbi:MAG: TRAP transporter substrate-binding protein [Alphaproteobacteria bacterium]|nr:TRAP transporter substrate-binding protein [Alphaproteobacteria bacterium]
MKIFGTAKSVAVLTIAGAIALGLAVAPASADMKKREFTVVGTWGFLDHWKEREGPFWKERLPKLSGGKLTANAKSQTELGMSGFEVMRLLKLGVYDAVHGVTTYVAQDSPAIEGADLAGVIQDLPTYRRANEAYRDVLAREFEEKYNAKLLMLYAWPSQQLFCNLGDKSIKTYGLDKLKGKKIRTYSTTLGDFIEGVGGSAVTIAFAEVVPALQKGVADCGLTGTLPAYNAKWYQVVTHNIRIRLGYASSFLAMNLKLWNDLDAETKALFKKELAVLEEEMWVATAKNDQRGMDCNAAGPCDKAVGGMVPIEPTMADKAILKDVVENFVLKRWAKRCGTQKCLDEWNATIGKISGMKASM